MSEPVRVLVLDTVMDRGGAETMTMNYLRRMDRSKVQYDFLVNRDYKAAYEGRDCGTWRKSVPHVSAISAIFRQVQASVSWVS